METKPTVEQFVIEPPAAAALAESAGVSKVADLLPLLVPSAQRLARPPISKFPVGAVGLGSSGRIFFGVNLEFSGLPLHHSVHAEQFLFAIAAAHGEPAICHLAVSSVPCGHCRQFLQEVRAASEIQISVTTDGGGPPAPYRPLGSILPHPFGPPDLLHKDVPLLLEPHDNKIGDLVDDGDVLGSMCNGLGVEAKLRAAAKQAAKAAHAPYSGCPSGFAVVDADGRVHAGSYAESAAYNPSLGPVQAAMVAFVAAGAGRRDEKGGWGGIVAAALVEKEAAAVSHEATARIFLAAVAPDANLKVYRFRSTSA